MDNRQSLQDERDQRLISNIFRLGLRLECITEEQKLKIEAQLTVRDKKLQLFEVLETMEDEEKASRLLGAIRFINARKFSHSSEVSELLLNAWAKLQLISIEKVPEFKGQGGQADLENFNAEKVSVNADINNLAIATKVIFLNPVARCIFKYLNLTDLDNCRLVCTEWNSVAQEILRTRSKFKISKFEKKIVYGTFPSYCHLGLTKEIALNCDMADIKELDLYRCRINLEDKSNCRPIVLKLRCVAFFERGSKLSEIFVNDYFDFSRLNHLDLKYHEEQDWIPGDEDCYVTRLSLDMKGNLKLEYLSLDEITVVNWRTCSWKVNKMYLPGVPGNAFAEETEMQIQELNFSANYYIDICCVPESIKKLTIAKACFCSRPVIFRNLQSLSLFLSNNSFSIISDLVKCPTLVTLDLEKFGRDQLEINSDWIPNTIKILKLGRVSINWTEEKNNLNLDKLVLLESPFSEVKKTCRALQHIKELIVCLPESEPVNENIFNFFLVRNSCDIWKTIVVGRFYWRNISFETSSLRHVVDKKAMYYTIENQIIKGFDDSLTFRKYESIQH